EPNGEFYHYHKGGMSDFLYPRGFGYVKDRAHVAGFKSHGFRSDPYPAWRSENWRWRVHHIQLVGILSHEQPVVYLTDKLPSMEEIRQGKTRTLDVFEEAALSALREGEDLFIASKGETVRMLGALRHEDVPAMPRRRGRRFARRLFLYAAACAGRKARRI